MTTEFQKHICCYQSCKDKNFKAIHNHDFATNNLQAVVINLAKIKILKQFTTSAAHASALSGCYQSCKDKNFKANHNKCCKSTNYNTTRNDLEPLCAKEVLFLLL